MASSPQRPKHDPAPQLPSPKPFAVLIDGSALFFASRTPEERRLNYFELMGTLVKHEKLHGLHASHDGSESIWTMWTAADPRNTGQMKFLEFAEDRLHWQVRKVYPSQTFMVEPDLLFGFGGAESTKASRLMRFDASIAFAMGRLAVSHRIVVISDSFALFEPMVRINENWGAINGKCALAFFGQACDTRWRVALRTTNAPDFIDLDEHQTELFGIEEQEVNRPALPPGKFVY